VRLCRSPLQHWPAFAALEEVLRGLGLSQLPPDRTYALLSGGERARLGLAALLSRPAPFLLLDEPEVYGLPPDPVDPTRHLGESWAAAGMAALGLAASAKAATFGNPDHPAEGAIVELAVGAEKRGDLDTAERLYEQALQRNAKSWKVAKLLAEFHRHRTGNLTEALRLYEQAAASAPRAGVDRALIFRERGILLSQAGTPDATDRAIESLEIAFDETANDAIAAHALGNMLVLAGKHRKAIPILEPLTNSAHTKTREMAITTLIRVYEATGEVVKLAETREKARRLGIK